MLESLRKVTDNRIFRIIFALFLVIPFGLFGIDAYFKGGPTGGDTVATVGSARVTSGEYDQAVRQQTELYRQQFGRNFDASIMENPEVRRGVLDRLVNEKLLLVGANKNGMRLDDKTLADRISSTPEFQVGGRFSRQRYEEIARANNLSPVGLDERLREDFSQQQFRRSFTETAIVPRSTVESFIRLTEQTRDVAVVNLTPDQYASQVKVTPDQVKAFYEANKAARFTTPERVRVEFVELSLDALAAQAQAPAEEVKSIYEEGLKAGRWGTREERRASHVLIATKPDASEADKKAAQQKAQGIADAVRKNPKSFAEVAKKESQDPGSGAQGGDLGFFGRGAMVKPFEDAVYAAKKGDIVGPVQSDFGWHVIMVTDLKPEKVKSLAEATPEIEAQVKKGAAQRRFAETAEQFTNIVYEQPASLKPAAEMLKVAIQQSPWITKGQPAPHPLLGNPKLAGELFSDDVVKAKRNTAAIEVAPNTLVAARLLEHKPAEQRPFESVQAEIERQLQRDEAVKLAKADGEAKLKLLQEGKDAGVKWPAPLAVNRQKPGGLFPQVIDRAFRVDARKLPAYAGAESPMGYSLVQVTKVTQPEKIDEAQRTALGNQLRQAVSMVEMDAALDQLRRDVGVSVRKDALEKKPN
jgi:peptidyl-prolyl cis-trans isomerase D